MSISSDLAVSREMGITPEQLAVLRMCLRDPENPLWSQALALIVGGLADEDCLRRAIRGFVSANDIFNFRFKPGDDGCPRRVAARDDFTAVEVTDARDVDPAELESEINWIILDEGEYGYDLTEDYPIRVRVLRIGDDRWVVLFLLHRLVYHRGVKVRYLEAFVSALKNSASSLALPLPQSMPSYYDYIQRVHEAIAPVASVTPVAPVALNEAGIVVQDFAVVQNTLRHLAQTHDVALPDILLSGVLLWNRMFSRIESPDLLVDLSTDFPLQAEGIIGPLSWRTAISATVPVAATIAELTRNLGTQLHAARTLMTFPHEFLGTGPNQVGGNGGRILCRFYDLDRVNIQTDDFWLGWSDADITSTECDLELIFKGGAGGLQLIVVYNQGLLSFEEAESWLRELTLVISRLAEQFDHSVAEFMRVLASEQVASLGQGRSWGAWTTRALAGQGTPDSLAHLFSVVAAQYPENIAVRTQTDTVRYRELEELSNRIAQVLSRRAGRGGRIGILLPQGLSAIAVILAVLKSGNAYVPLDVSMPESRLRVMVADAELSLLITDGNSAAVRQGSVWDRLPVLSLDQLTDHPADGLVPALGAGDDDAYIIYTSGSTGTPKGVLQSQRNVLHYIETYSRMLEITESDSLTLMSAYLFDAAVVDIFTALFNGATLVVFDLKKEDFSTISRRLQESRVTIFHSTPSVFRYFTDSLDSAVHFDRIRYVVLGGEQARRGDLARLKNHFAAGATLINLYGSSELTIGSMEFFPQGTEVTSEILPIGAPLDSMVISMLSEDGIPTPGVGQLVVSSPYLAKQYWNRPDLTAEKFTPAHCLADERTFLTGDIGEITGAGELRHLGRSDFQFKIRGYRVEPGEIESRIGEYNGVAKCVVHPVSVGDGELLLAAFIIPAAGSIGPGIEGLADFLKDSLPDYMIPQVFLPILAFPETPTGKINRRKLEEIANEHLAAR